MESHWAAAWLLITCFLTVCLTAFSQGKDLKNMVGVALDRNRELPPMRVRSVYAPFIDKSKLWVQLWSSVQVSPRPRYQLEWQALIQPARGNGAMEYVPLKPHQHVYIPINSSYRLGISNMDFPGPLDGVPVKQAVSSEDFPLLLSINATTPLNISDVLTFDDLALPYDIPLHLCEDTDCPKVFGAGKPQQGQQSRQPVTIGFLGEDTFLLSERMILGLIIWNIVLTVLLLIILMVLVCLCAGLERRKKYKSSDVEGEGMVQSSSGWKPTDSWRNEQRVMTSDTSSDKQHLAQADQLSHQGSEHSGIEKPFHHHDPPMDED